MSHWYILNREGDVMEAASLPQRPADARRDDGDPFTPYYKQDDHLHIEHGRIEGIHAQGDLEDVRKKLEHYLALEPRLLEATGGNEDILLNTADEILQA